MGGTKENQYKNNSLEFNSSTNLKFSSNENLSSLGVINNNNNSNDQQILHTDGDFNKKVNPKGSDFTLNKKNNDFIEILDNIKIKEGNNLETNFNILEKKLETKLQIIKQENEKNKILNLTKKYSAYRSIFEDSIKTIHQTNNIKSNNLLNKLFNGYNDTVQTLFMNFSKLHDKFSEGETVYQSKKIIKFIIIFFI